MNRFYKLSFRRWLALLFLVVCFGSVCAQTFPDWESTNHSDSSTSDEEYTFEVSAGDVLTFNYMVDSETSYDMLIVKINNETVLTESGSKSGSYRKEFTASGTVTLYLSYVKDSSVSNGQDCARVTDITLQKAGTSGGEEPGEEVPGYDGYVGKEFSYTYMGSTITYEVTDVDARTCKMKQFNDWEYGSSHSLIIPAHPKDGEVELTLTAIGSNVMGYSWGSEIISIAIPPTVTECDYEAFSGLRLGKCAYPNTIYEPFGGTFRMIKYPAEGAFIEDGIIFGADKTAIYFVPESYNSSIRIPASVTYIADYALSGCHGIVSVEEDNPNYSSDGYALYNKDKTELIQWTYSSYSYSIPNSVTSIGVGAFYGFSGLDNISIPNSVTTIGDYAFYGCYRLSSVEIGTGVTSIGDCVFYQYDGREMGFDNLKTLYFNAENCTHVGRDTFGNGSEFAPIGIETVILGNGVQTIPAGIFSGFNRLTTIDIPESVTSIGDRAFQGCSLTGELVLPNSLTSIGESAFGGNSSLTSVTIPSSVKVVGPSAFSYCSSLKVVALEDDGVVDDREPTTTTFPNWQSTNHTDSSTSEKEYTMQVEPGDVLSFIYKTDCEYYDKLIVTIDGVQVLSAKSTESGYYYKEFTEAGTVTLNLSYQKDFSQSEGADCAWVTDIILESPKQSEVTLPDMQVTHDGSSSYSIQREFSFPVSEGDVLSFDYKVDGGYMSNVVVKVGDSYDRCWSNHWRQEFTESGMANIVFSVYENETISLTNIKLTRLTGRRIGEKAFAGCQNVETFNSYAVNPPTCESEAFGDINKQTCTLYVPHGRSAAYRAANQWKDFQNIVEIQPVLVSEIELNRSTLELNLGDTFQLEATVKPEDADNREVEWSSSDPETVSVDENGLVTALKSGSAIITVRSADGNAEATCSITVLEPAPVLVAEIELNSQELELNLGDTFQLEATVSPEDADNIEVEWSSSDPETVSVDENGLVTALKAGSAIITVRSADGNAEATCSVTILEPEPVLVAEIELSDQELELHPGDTFQLEATVKPEDADNTEVEWSSSDPETVSVDENGLVTALKSGSAIITVRSADGNAEATCSVIVRSITTVTNGEVTFNFNENQYGQTIYSSSNSSDYMADGTSFSEGPISITANTLSGSGVRFWLKNVVEFRVMKKSGITIACEGGEITGVTFNGSELSQTAVNSFSNGSSSIEYVNNSGATAIINTITVTYKLFGSGNVGNEDPDKGTQLEVGKTYIIESARVAKYLADDNAGSELRLGDSIEHNSFWIIEQGSAPGAIAIKNVVTGGYIFDNRSSSSTPIDIYVFNGSIHENTLGFSTSNDPDGSTFLNQNGGGAGVLPWSFDAGSEWYVVEMQPEPVDPGTPRTLYRIHNKHHSGKYLTMDEDKMLIAADLDESNPQQLFKLETVGDKVSLAAQGTYVAEASHSAEVQNGTSDTEPGLFYMVRNGDEVAFDKESPTGGTFADGSRALSVPHIDSAHVTTWATGTEYSWWYLEEVNSMMLSDLAYSNGYFYGNITMPFAFRTDAEVYTGQFNNNMLDLNKIDSDYVAAGTPVIIRSASPEATLYFLENADETATQSADNHLSGTLFAIDAPESAHAFCLIAGTERPAFIANNRSIGRNESYLDSNIADHEEVLLNTGNAVSIDELTTDGTIEVYDLRGVKVSDNLNALPHSVYILKIAGQTHKIAI